jgi:hypothetical protein
MAAKIASIWGLAKGVLQNSLCHLFWVAPTAFGKDFLGSQAGEPGAASLPSGFHGLILSAFCIPLPATGRKQGQKTSHRPVPGIQNNRICCW